jgi:hypothetical protein
MTLTAGTAAGPTDRARTQGTRGECSTFVELARRMNITPDDAIRQFIDLNRRHPTGRPRQA